jgi:hypothetical protein
MDHPIDKPAQKCSEKTRGQVIHRGVLIQRPAMPPDTPNAKIRRGAKLAVKAHVRDLAITE